MEQSNLTAAQKRKWLAELRSGKFAQVKSALCDLVDDDSDSADETYGYCCLGVLATTLGYGATPAGETLDDLSENVLGPFNPIGMDAGTPEFNADNKQTHTTLQRKLVGMNDGSGRSFKQIAAWIEKNVATRGRRAK